MSTKQIAIARRRLIKQWDDVTSALSTLCSAAEVRPENGNSVFSSGMLTDEGTIAFELRPVVFNLPERADDRSVDLYVVVEGSLSLQKESIERETPLLTQDFSTRAAYFRKTKAGLTHVYGAHYDFSLNELGHPTFHMQLRSFSDLAAHAKAHYKFARELDEIDKIDGVLRNVRLPCAQMDFFSFTYQLCADHLLFKDSEKEVKRAFNQLVENGSFLRGAGSRSDRLATDAARICYRSGHWYPKVV